MRLRATRIVRGRRSRVLRGDCPQGQRSPLGRLLIRLVDGWVDFVSISSMTVASAALSRKWAELVYLNMGRAIRKFKLRSCRA